MERQRDPLRRRSGKRTLAALWTARRITVRSQNFKRFYGTSAVESVLNRLFKIAGISVRDALTVRGNAREGIVEQIDGVIKLDSDFYLVEVKWHTARLGVGDVSHHLVRLHARDGARGLLISSHGFTGPAISAVRDHLTKLTAVLCELDEIVLLLEGQHDLGEFLRKKVESAILDRNPFVRPLG